jgi:hypothetical protein
MGFYLRTSLRAGPFRYNLSRSGVGVSVGVPGFRIGTGPRGNYVHMGRGGIYYRTTLNNVHVPRMTPPAPRMPPMSAVVLQDITGASVQELFAANPSDLVVQLQEASRRTRLWPFVLGGLLIVAIALGIWGLLLLLVGAPAVVWLALRDQARRAVVVMYDVNDQAAQQFGQIVDATEVLRRAQRIWFVPAAGAVRTTYQYKVNSGASTIIQRQGASVSMAAPRDSPPTLRSLLWLVVIARSRFSLTGY